MLGRLSQLADIITHHPIPNHNIIHWLNRKLLHIWVISKLCFSNDKEDIDKRRRNLCSKQDFLTADDISHHTAWSMNTQTQMSPLCTAEVILIHVMYCRDVYYLFHVLQKWHTSMSWTAEVTHFHVMFYRGEASKHKCQCHYYVLQRWYSSMSYTAEMYLICFKYCRGDTPPCHVLQR